MLLPALLFASGGLVSQIAHGQCDPLPSGCIGWWPGDGTATDFSGNHLDGVLMNGTSFTTGIVGQAFNLVAAQSNCVQIATANGLLPTAGQGWTVVAWINPKDITSTHGIVHKGASSGYPGPGDHWFLYVAYGGCLVFENGSYCPTSGQIEAITMQTTTIIKQGWQHVALVVTNMGSLSVNNYKFYLNGVPSPTYARLLPSGPLNSPVSTYPLLIGAVRDYSHLPAQFFDGAIDEVAIFNRALSQSEIVAVYAAGSAGICKPPQIIAQPQNQIGYWGGNVSLSVSATSSSPPLYYQWLKNGIPISNATSASLVLNNLQSTNAGSYTVVVSDSAGNAITSNPGNLTVAVAGVNVGLYAGVVINGIVGQTYGIQSLTNFGSSSWIGRTNITLATPTFLWQDTQPTTAQPNNYYRVVQGPISIP
ncbi:MAG: LamG-like jellyroll fold domain-containing protein [Verrucomicrobiota bacterium]